MVNQMKEQLLQGNAAFGVSVMIPSVQIVEMVGKLGFDWVLIDCEHGAISLETVELMAMAAQASGLIPIVRPPKNDTETILQYMDRGVMGIQAPHIGTAEEAKAVVSAVKYHPLGTRSLAVGTRAANYGFGITLGEYTQQANKEILVCVQIEDKDALNNINAIAGVEGIDVLFIGPSDLSQSLGHPGNSEHPVVQKAMRNAFETIVSSGKVAGTAGNFDVVTNRLKQGVAYYYVHLTTILNYSCCEFFSRIRKI